MPNHKSTVSIRELLRLKRVRVIAKFRGHSEALLPDSLNYDIQKLPRQRVSDVRLTLPSLTDIVSEFSGNNIITPASLVF